MEMFQVRLEGRDSHIQNVAASSAEAAMRQLRVPDDERPLRVVFLSRAAIDRAEASRLVHGRRGSTTYLREAR